MATETLTQGGVTPDASQLAKNNRRRMALTAYMYILPAALIMAFMTLWPLIYQFWMSFTNYSNRNLRTDSLIGQMVGTFTGNLETYNSPSFVGVQNYIDTIFGQLAAVLSGYDFWRILLFNLVWTAVNLVFHVGLGVVIALILNQKGLWLRPVYRSLFIIPWAMPALVSAMIWRNMFDDVSGAVNRLIGGLGGPGNTRWLQQLDPPFPYIPPFVRVQEAGNPFFWMLVMLLLFITPFFIQRFRGWGWKAWLGWLVLLQAIFLVVPPLISPLPGQAAVYGMGQLFPLSFYAVLTANIWLGWPFMMAVATGGLQSIPGDLYEAAAVDGATWWSKFWSITVPLLRPAMIPAIIIGMTMTFNQFNVIYFISGGGPLHQTEILVTQAYRLVNDTTVNLAGVGNVRPYGIAAAFAYIVFVVLAVITLITNRYSRATAAVTE